MKTLKILLVEDDGDIRNLIKLQLELAGHQVTSSPDGGTAISMIDSNYFDLFILDRMLPVYDGLYICKYIRQSKRFHAHPILMVTALTDPDKIVEGLDSGADDYIGKPFDLNILMARIRSLSRRVPGDNLDEVKGILEFGLFKMDVHNHRFFLNKNEVALTKSEFGILSFLLKNIGRVLTRSELKKEIQGGDVFVTDRTIDTHIFGLRKKLLTSSSSIESVRGIGYRFSENNS